MELTIYENSAPVGTLRIFPQGLYTVFEARLPAKPPLPKGGCPSAHTGAGGYTHHVERSKQKTHPSSDKQRQIPSKKHDERGAAPVV